jgi:serine protease AprX
MAEKLSSDPRFTGRGVCIAFLDSGFYPHPDFAPRVAEFHDVSGEENGFQNRFAPEGHHWHGTQTVTACAGDGSLSEGIYRGLAHEASLVLVKVSREGRIGDDEIEEGLRWVIENRERLGIRILNMSLGGDCDVPTATSKINQLVEQLSANGVVVTVAAGNFAERRSLPPASAPSAITVGGFSDENKFDEKAFELYNSSYGDTADGIVKPELIAPAMYVAAPLLPGTKEYASAEALSAVATAPDYAFRRLAEKYWEVLGLEEQTRELDVSQLRCLVDERIAERKIVSVHYQHVDGTSFAAPITASVVAQMLEANQSLSPAVVKNILTSTASRLSGRPAVRQGYGMLNAKLAVELAEREVHSRADAVDHQPRILKDKIVFGHHDDQAKTVHLVGDMNRWDEASVPFERCENGLGEFRFLVIPRASIDTSFSSMDPAGPKTKVTLTRKTMGSAVSIRSFLSLE